jgi:hypothetical protein
MVTRLSAGGPGRFAESIVAVLSGVSAEATRSGAAAASSSSRTGTEEASAALAAGVSIAGTDGIATGPVTDGARAG